MKIYLNEAETAAAFNKTSSGFRRPFKLLQDLQFFRSANMSSKVSLPLKASATRSKRVETNQQKEPQSKNRFSNSIVRQTIATKNSTNVRSSCKSPNSSKKQEISEVKSRISESSNSSGSSVGSLTSSPKWSHIKNKFENSESIMNYKSISSVQNMVKKSTQPAKTTKSSSSTNIENVSFVHRNKYLAARKEVEKKNDILNNKTENSSSTKTVVDRTKFSSTNSRNETQKLKSRSASPKNVHVTIPTANVSSLHSNYTVKKLSSTVSNVLKSSHSSSSASPESSLKSSRCSSPNTISNNSPTTKAVPSSILNSIPTNKSVKNSSKSFINPSNNIHAGNAKTSISSIVPTSSYLCKNTLHELKTSLSSRAKQKIEDKPTLIFNQFTETSKSFLENKPVKEPVESDIDVSPNITLSSTTRKLPKTALTSTSCNSSGKTQNLENIEKIKDITRNSQSASKTVWVKDSVGNWIKKSDADAKTTNNSKVSVLRRKFMDSSTKDGNNVPLTKSSTTSSVPSKAILNSRPLAKSITTSSMSDKVFLDNLSKKLANVKDAENGKTYSTDGESSKTSHKKESENEDVLKLNIVQRAILSYEGNIVLLSPETQRRLKLVSEKVQAQTDDDKIKRAKTKNIPQGNSKAYSEKKSDVNTALKHSCNVSRKSNAQSSVGEPVLPIRNFLTRYQKSKLISPNEQSQTSAVVVDTKTKFVTKQSESKQAFFSNVSSNSLNKVEIKESQSSVGNGVLKRSESSASNNKSLSKLTMDLENPSDQIDKKSDNQENNYSLQPNSSFLWRRSDRSDKAPSEYSKSSTTSSVSLTSSDYKNYYDIDNYYSSLELEIDKRSENSEEHIYIDSQGSNSSDNYAMSTYSAYENIPDGKPRNGSQDEWTEISDDDFRKNSVSSNNQSSTLKKKKSKRNLSYRDSLSNSTKSQTEQRSQMSNDTYSFTDSSDTLINDEVENESACDIFDANHFYEPVYESLGNYLINQDEEENYENCSNSVSPDEPENEDFMHCSITSLESAESLQQDKDENSMRSITTEEKNAENKKTGNAISQLKRHLSWTKNDIRLELSSKFNKIKIKKNGRTSTEIGLKMQDSENLSTSPKKKTFIKCILRQKSASSIPLKRSPSPKKESALFYVHLTMGREKQRPCSESAVAIKECSNLIELPKNIRQQSDPAITLNAALKNKHQVPRSRKFASGHIIQRPKTPPPLPPVQAVTNKVKEDESPEKKFQSSATTLIYETSDGNSEIYTDLDYIDVENQKQLHPYENEVLRFIHAEGKSRTSNSTSVEEFFFERDAPSDGYSKSESKYNAIDLSLPLFQSFQSEHLKSPFEEEPMYQFYQKDVQQRATLWLDGSESEFEDDVQSKLSDPDYQSVKRPVLQSQLSAMELVHGDGGQRRLWCEVPEVIQSGILKTISPNDRKIQEAMFEVITSEASYLKSLNFLIEHFVQCVELSGDYGEKHVLDKRERHILFSDIQPVRDVSASVLGDLEKRWLKDIVLNDISDILYHHASKCFSVYVKYCSNQLYQERLLRELKEKRPEFVAVLKRLESNPVCQGLDMHSFLMLPMQRITRLPLLIDAIFRRLTVDSPIYESCKIALATVNKIVAECNEGACKMQRMEEMLVISQQIDFKACKGLGLLSASRYLVKKGELVQLLMDNANRRTFGRSSRWCKIQLYLFLFTDLLVVTRKKSDDSYTVVDYCPRNMLQVMPMDENTPPLPLRLPASYRNVFQLIMLNNKEGKTVEMLLSCLLESDRTRWMSAVMPAKSENPDEKIYEEWDCPQVQCTHAYNAQQPDELSLEEADVVNVFKKMSDGWFEGERIRDGIRGWFPSSHTVEIINSHVRARNLHQRYRLLMLSQSYLEEQHKAQAQNKK